jgi:hypothetical protein
LPGIGPTALCREVREETGIEVAEISLVGVYSDIDRDPRGHIVSVAFMTKFTNEIRARSGSDAGSAEYVAIRHIDLAFDHARIFNDAKSKLTNNDGSRAGRVQYGLRSGLLHSLRGRGNTNSKAQEQNLVPGFLFKPRHRGLSTRFVDLLLPRSQRKL